MKLSVITLTIGILLAGCNGYKIISKSSFKPDIKKVDGAGKYYCILRTDRFPEIQPVSFEQLQMQGQGLEQIRFNSDDVYNIPVLNHKDLIFEFDINNIHNIPRIRGDVRTFLSPILFPITIPASMIYVRKKNSYLIGQLKVYLPNGDLISTYENYEVLIVKKQAIMDPIPRHEVVTKVFNNGYSGLINNLINQYNHDTVAQNFIRSKQNVLSLNTVIEINQAFFLSYYSRFLRSLEDHAKSSYDIMSKDLIKKFKRRQMTFEEDYVPIAFYRYLSLKSSRLLEETDKKEAEAFLNEEIRNYEQLWKKYNTSKEKIISNREKLNTMLSTLAMAAQQSSTAYSLLDRQQQTITHYMQIFTSSLQRNIATNYPHLSLSPGTPSLFATTSFNQGFPTSQLAIGDNLQNSPCSEDQQITCSNKANADPVYQSWYQKLSSDPREHYALQAAIARYLATLNYCKDCLTEQQKISIKNAIEDCKNRLSQIASDKYVSAVRPDQVQSIKPPGYGYKTASKEDNTSQKSKTKVSSKAQ
ncbi:MAG: hypothetical protein QM763_19075 [Agriterribacter sp.]